MRIAIILAALAAALSAAPVAAQTIPVLGVGSVGFDVALPRAEAEAQRYRLYAPATTTAAGVVLTVTCGATVNNLTPCRFPLSSVPLPATGTQSLAITAAVTAADGERESPRVTAPFVLTRAAQAVAPAASAMSVQPPQP